ncbi:flagellin [Hyphomonas oceanitis]|uniref:Putative flagellar hook-associated protein FlgL n=1 Tax=Hyphomonas oceanitis SCH89 TaxID=1280953 RepID=A0A059G4P7_9PROT|nr:flagellin [Hyphomonas oceanitis]KDA01817.1 putative flagellar hook-associated protein FlgL [Hyphomonas oceanitis SCH89]
MLRFLPPSSLTSSQGLSPEIKAIRDRLETTSKETVTGRYEDMTRHLSGRISQAMLGQKAIDDIEQQGVRLQIREGRLELTQRSLEVVQSSISGLPARMQAALASDDVASKTATARDSRSALSETFSALNVRYGERYLFAGDAATTPPFASVDDLLSDIRQIATTATDDADFAAQLDTYFNSPTGGWRANIYAGTETASDPESVPGTNDSLLKIISGLAVMALSGPDEALPILNGASSAVAVAAQSLTDGQTSLINVRAVVGLSQARVQTEKESLGVEKTVLTAAFNELTARDQYEAASELKELESSLEAAYTLTSRLANLTLLNFLR